MKKRSMEYFKRKHNKKMQDRYINYLFLEICKHETDMRVINRYINSFPTTQKH